jgi:hypothetical protein
MESGGAECAYGPLALWHDAPRSTVGLVLEADEAGVLQPQVDADPTARMPRPVDPLDAAPGANSAAPGSDPPAAPLPPDEGPGGRADGWILVGLASAAALGVLVFVYRTSRRIKRRRRRRRWTDA